MIGSNGRPVVDLKKLCCVIALGAMAPFAFAQDKFDRELEFVRGLAREMRFIELAKSEAERLATQFRDASQQDKIAQLSVEITYYGARSRSDRNQQRALFKETIEKSKQLVDQSKDERVQLGARLTLAEASADYGKFLVEEIEIARTESPDKVKEIEAEAAKVFDGGIEACETVRKSFSGSEDPEKQGRAYQMWLQAGVLMREQGRADKANRSVLVTRAINHLTELIYEAGEETYVGMRALFEIAQSREVDGKTTEAIDSYRSTIRTIVTSLEASEKGELELGRDLESAMFEMLQEVYERVGDVMVKQGSPETPDLFAEFRKHVAQFGEKGKDLFDVVSDQFGHLMLLAESKFLAESGDPKKVADAMAMVKRINDKHPNDFVGVRAKAVLRDILAVQQNLVSGGLLFEIAKGEFQNKNLEAAIKGLHRAIPTLTGDDAKKFGLEAWQMLGTAYGQSERYVEAILAFGEGLKRHAGDDEKRAGEAADALDRAISALKRQSKNDPYFETLYRDAAELIKTYSVGGGAKLFWKQGNDLFQTDKKYAEAIAQFEQIDAKFLYYERARVNIGRAQLMLGEFDKARQSLAAYRTFAKENEIEARDTARQQVRQVAMLEADWAEVQMAYMEARGSTELKRKKDLAKYPEAVQKVEAFLAANEKDGAQNQMVVYSLEYLGRLAADQAQLDKAEAARVRLKAIDKVRSASLATDIFRELQARAKSQTEELNKAIAGDKGEQVIDKATAELEATQRSLVALGLDYVATSPKPQLGVLVATAQTCEQLGEWQRVDEIARKILADFESDTSDQTKKVLDQVVRPMVGEALLQLRKFTEALTMLEAAEKANPQRLELKRQIARALGGWLEYDKSGRARVEPGLEKPVEAYAKFMQDYYQVRNKTAEMRKFSLDWYRMQWEAFWFAKRAATKDSKYKGYADSIYASTRSTDDFATLKTFGAEGLRLHKNFMNNRN